MKKSGLRPPRRGARRGAVLVLFSFAAIGIFALLSLTVDLGYAKLTQEQMQCASDSAAMEALRYRDDQSIARSQRENKRRTAAKEFMDRIFDDDYDAATAPDVYGAGPIIDLDGGVTGAFALQTIQVSDDPCYRPDLQLNPGNDPHGDVVMGTFDFNVFPHDETAWYSRNDFSVSSQSNALRQPSALVRLRRTKDFNFLDTCPGVSTAGPPLPFLFGRGSLIKVDNPDAVYNPRQHGLSLRSTSIAHGRAVMAVGFANAGLGLFGRTRFALERTAYTGLLGRRSTTVTVSATGVITQTSNGKLFGQFLPATGSTQVGEIVPATVAPVSSDLTGYAPVVATFQGQRRVVGFMYARLTPTSTLPGSATLVREAALVAWNNATALPKDCPDLTPTQLESLFAITRGIEEPLLAPVLAR